jgi:hypothetical protein
MTVQKHKTSLSNSCFSYILYLEVDLVYLVTIIKLAIIDDEFLFFQVSG